MNSHSAPHVPDSVPGKAHYSLKYLHGGRIFSYAHQINTALSFEPRNALEVGKGSGMVAAALRATGIEVTTLDIQPELEPDLVGSVTDIPAEAAAFDIGICCQVLEHLPFEQFELALAELHRVCRNGLVLSLPDVTRWHYLEVKLPWFGTRLWDWSVSRWRPSRMPSSRFETSGHFWELGFAGYPFSRIRSTIVVKGWQIVRTWRVRELPWHRFFQLNRNACEIR